MNSLYTKVKDSIDDLLLIQVKDQIYKVMVVHNDYGSPRSIDKYIAEHLPESKHDKTYMCINGDVDTMRFDREYVLACINAKIFIDGNRSGELQYTETDMKDFYIVPVFESCPPIKEYDGMELIQGWCNEVYAEDLIKMIKEGK